MSFLNKLWKNLRDHKSSSSDAQHGSSSNSHKKSLESSGEYNTAAVSGNSHSYSQRKSSTLNFRVRKSSDHLDSHHHHLHHSRADDRHSYDRENIAPPTPSKRQQQQQFSHSNHNNSKDTDAGLTDDSGFELDNSSEEFQLPPGILSDLAKHPTVSRHLSVSRSGRYKHRNKMRSNLFDVVKRDEDPQHEDPDVGTKTTSDQGIGSDGRQESRGAHPMHDPRALDHHHHQLQQQQRIKSRKGTFATAVDAEVHHQQQQQQDEENRLKHPAHHHHPHQQQQQQSLVRRDDNSSSGMMMDHPVPVHPHHRAPATDQRNSRCYQEERITTAARGVNRNNGSSSSHADNSSNSHHLTSQSNRPPRRPLPITPPMPPVRHGLRSVGPPAVPVRHTACS